MAAGDKKVYLCMTFTSSHHDLYSSLNHMFGVLDSNKANTTDILESKFVALNRRSGTTKPNVNQHIKCRAFPNSDSAAAYKKDFVEYYEKKGLTLANHAIIPVPNITPKFINDVIVRRKYIT